MLERQREGIAKAKVQGKYKGRAPTVAHQADQIRAMKAAGVKPVDIARKLRIARSSVYRMLELRQNDWRPGSRTPSRPVARVPHRVGPP